MSKRGAAKVQRIKRPLGAYMLFCKDARPSVKAANPEAKVTQMASLLGAAWRALTPDEQAPYKEKAKELKAEYDAMKAAAGSDDERFAPKKKKQRKGAKAKKNGPKRPLGAYMLYCKDARPQIKAGHPEAKVTEIAKLLGAAWRALSEREQQPYRDEAAALKSRYAQDKAAFDAAEREALAAQQEYDDEDLGDGYGDYGDYDDEGAGGFYSDDDF